MNTLHRKCQSFWCMHAQISEKSHCDASYVKPYGLKNRCFAFGAERFSLILWGNYGSMLMPSRTDEAVALPHIKVSARTRDWEKNNTLRERSRVKAHSVPSDWALIYTLVENNNILYKWFLGFQLIRITHVHYGFSSFYYWLFKCLSFWKRSTILHDKKD